MSDLASWIVVGSSPTAPAGLRRVIADWPGSTTIACNAAIDLFRAEGKRPDFYWLSDQVACQRYQDDARWCRDQGGLLATAKREPEAMRLRGVDDADIIAELPEPPDSKPVFHRGRFVHAKFSGLLCLQFAANAKAERIALVGMDGYESQPGNRLPDSFDGRLGKGIAAKQTAEWIGPFTQSVFNACPDVEFRIYGRPRFPWQAGNLTVIECG